uniref:procollagen-proline 4-dioxygenase n=1 Tax=Ciona intestinalis TaxID=7719 RepID=F6YH71_CIOIN
FLVLLNFAIIASADKNDWFSTTAGMQNLIDVENNFLSTLEGYIEGMQMSLDKIKTFKDIMRKDVIPAVSDPEVYIGHPINQYALIKRFALKWSRVGELLDGYSRKGKETRAQYHDAIKMLPNEDDMIGAAEAIARLQSYYSLNMDDLTNGNVKDVTSPSLLNSKDCFRIGKSAYTNRRFDLCEIWMNKSLELYVEQKGITRENIWSYLKHKISFKTYQGVNQTMHINAFLEDDTNNQESSTAGYDIILIYINSEVLLVLFINRIAHTQNYEYKKINSTLPKNITLHLLQNSLTLPQAHFVFQQYTHFVQCQAAWSKKSVNVFVNILIQVLLFYQLLRANGASSDGFGKIKYRISNTAWLDDKDSSSVKRLSQRLADVTGLTGSSELLQVANYGMAGHYIAHFDAMTPDDRNENYEYGNTGQRIATALVYLSEVQKGGSTAFFYPNIVAEPIKGSAVFWYNLYPSGALDKRTLHAACPVLIGNKWACNKWFRELGHEFVRKCGLFQNAENRMF